MYNAIFGSGKKSIWLNIVGFFQNLKLVEFHTEEICINSTCKKVIVCHRTKSEQKCIIVNCTNTAAAKQCHPRKTLQGLLSVFVVYTECPLSACFCEHSASFLQIKVQVFSAGHFQNPKLPQQKQFRFWKICPLSACFCEHSASFLQIKVQVF